MITKYEYLCGCENEGLKGFVFPNLKHSRLIKNGYIMGILKGECDDIFSTYFEGAIFGINSDLSDDELVGCKVG